MRALHQGDEQRKRADKRRPSRATVAAVLLFVFVVCVYLIRLEAHTGADILLPIDYHAVVHVNDAPGASEAGSIDAYYQSYAWQAGRPYTIRQDLLLSRLAYIKAPQGFRGEIAGVTVQALCDEIERILHDPALDAVGLLGRDHQDTLAITSEISAQGSLGQLVIREYITDPSGLAGYVLENDGDITIAFRGTDDGIDMVDNVLLLPFNLSMQYNAIRDILGKYGEAEHIWLTGHSKGGHNALYAASIDPRCHATGFNAPGFGIFLSDAQHDGLDRGVNYVINGDVTGFLLFHLERRVVLESTDSIASGNKHRLNNFFSIDDLAVANRIEPLAVACEWITQILWLALLFLVGYGVIRLLKRIGSRITGRKLP